MEKEEKILEPEFKVSLVLSGIPHEGKGKTALDALVDLSSRRPEKLMGKAVVTISKGEKSKEILFPLARLKRLFYNKDFQGYQAKYLTLLVQ